LLYNIHFPFFISFYFKHFRDVIQVCIRLTDKKKTSYINFFNVFIEGITLNINTVILTFFMILCIA